MSELVFGKILIVKENKGFTLEEGWNFKNVLLCFLAPFDSTFFLFFFYILLNDK